MEEKILGTPEVDEDAFIERSDTLAQKVYDILWRKLLVESFKPGERLVETELAKSLGISRTPVREALNRLTTDGLLEHGASGGVFVRNLSIDLDDFYSVRERLESLAAAQAAQRASKEDKERLLAICTVKGTSRKDATARLEASRNFHKLLIEISGNEFLLTLVKGGLAKFFLGRSMLPFYEYDDVTFDRLAERHQQIATAVAQGDAALAEKLVSEHFAMIREIISKRLHKNGQHKNLVGGESLLQNKTTEEDKGEGWDATGR